MKSDRMLEDSYWRKELQAFQAFVTMHPSSTYRDWQPTKWQSLSGITSILRKRYGISTALELGCGSATLLLQLAAAGWTCTGVDRSRNAIMLAHRAGESLEVHSADLQVMDFWSLPQTRHDIVFSIGVIEHFDEEGQLELLKMHFHHATKAVLIAIPNLTSPVFNSYIEWARRKNRLYERKHVPISVPRLAAQLGRKIHVADGAHLFFSRSEYFIPGDSALETFYASLAKRLVEIGGTRYSAFPHMDLTAADIDILACVEQQAGTEERICYGFLNYFLLE
jgi:SAM-dependent methyltransferase